MKILLILPAILTHSLLVYKNKIIYKTFESYPDFEYRNTHCSKVI